MHYAFAHTAAMTIASTLKALRGVTGESQAALGRAAKVSQATINRIESGETLQPDMPTLEGIARHFRISIDALRGPTDVAVSEARAAMGSVPAEPLVQENVEAGARTPVITRIPVVGKARLGDNGHFVELEYPAGHGDGWVEATSRDPHAYAVRCVGDSMKPRIKHGEYVIVEPSVRAQPGDEVLVKSADDRVMVKTFMYVRAGRYYFHSVNSDDHPPIVLDESEIVSLHPVVNVVRRGQWSPD